MKTPVIHPNAYIAPNATVVGDVHIGAGSSVFFGSVLRGDREPITIGEDTNIQDNCVLHQEYGCPTTVGSRVTVGHGAILHGCTIGDETLIGMGAILLNGAVIGRHCIVGAGALVTQNTVIPDGSLVYGSPAGSRASWTRPPSPTSAATPWTTAGRLPTGFLNTATNKRTLSHREGVPHLSIPSSPAPGVWPRRPPPRPAPSAAAATGPAAPPSPDA